MVSVNSAPLQSERDDALSLTIQNLNKTFVRADGVEVEALRDFSLKIDAGELVSLVGPSGCGKSTLLRLIAGLDSPDSGELWVGTQRIIAPSAERGLVFQDPNLYP